MSEFQKVIKYLAMAFAIFLTFVIVSGIVGVLINVTGILNTGSQNGSQNSNQNSSQNSNQNNSQNSSQNDKDSIWEEFDNVKSITIDVGACKLVIREGDSDKVLVEGSNLAKEYIVEMRFNGNLNIRSKSHHFSFDSFSSGKNAVITVYLPEGFTSEKLKIDAGAGNIELYNIHTKNLDIDAGAGNIYGEYLYADKLDLDGGVGNIILEYVEFYETDIDSGVGNVEITGTLYGKSKIDCGVGEVSLKLTNSSDDYKLKVEKGLGNLKINGQKYSNISWNNDLAEHTLTIKGGIGNINIQFDYSF